MIRNILLFTAGVTSGVLLMFVVPSSVKMPSMTQVHHTTEPILLYSNVANATKTLLPVGTPLYYDATTSNFDKLGERYVVYVTLRGDFQLTARTDLGEPQSIDGRAVRINYLPELQGKHPLTSEDVTRIIKKECGIDAHPMATTTYPDGPQKDKK